MTRRDDPEASQPPPGVEIHRNRCARDNRDSRPGVIGGGDPTETPSPADDTDGTSIPGFGALAALGGIGGTAYLHRHQRYDEDG